MTEVRGTDAAARHSDPTRRAFLAAGAGALAAGCSSCSSWAARMAAPQRVPLIYDRSGALMIEARIGAVSRRWLLDTGAERSAMSRAFARELGAPLRGGGEVEGTAGVVRTESLVAEIVVADLVRQEIDFTVYDLMFADPQCVGILGAEFFGGAPLQLRYRDGELVWRAPRPAAAMPMTLDHGIPRVAAAVGDVSLSLRLDTGASLPPGDAAYVNVTQAEAARLGLRGKPLQVWAATGTGGARLELPVHRLPSLRVGDRVLDEAFAIVQPRVGYFARDDAVGFLGNAVLDKLDPFLDYHAGRFACTRGV